MSGDVAFFKMVEAEGLEPTAPPNKTKGGVWGCTRKLTPNPVSPELKDIIRAWDGLPNKLRSAILEIINMARTGKKMG